jgi:hypothetical protein
MRLSPDAWEQRNDAVPTCPSAGEAKDQPSQTPDELKEESRKIRRLQIMVNMVMQVIAQDQSLTVEEASEMVADTRKAALAMFPEKEFAFSILFWPRLQRLMRERYRMQ